MQAPVAQCLLPSPTVAERIASTAAREDENARGRRLGLAAVVRETALRWWRSDAPMRSAALAFYTLFSMAPVLVVSVAITGAVFGEEATRAELQAQVRELAGEQSAATVRQVLDSAARPDLSRMAGLVGAVTLLFGATVVFGQLQQALNAVWGVQPAPGRAIRNFLRKRLLSLGLVLVIGFLLLVSLVLSAAVSAVGAFLQRLFDFPAALLNTVDFVLFFAVITVLFALMFKVLPDAVVSWRDVAVGAVVTALMFSIGKELIGLYIGRAGVASPYGVAGSLVLLLLWVYYSSMILLLGAGFTRVWSRRHRPPGVVPEPGALNQEKEEERAKEIAESRPRAAAGLVLALAAILAPLAAAAQEPEPAREEPAAEESAPPAEPDREPRPRRQVTDLDVEIDVAGENLVQGFFSAIRGNVEAMLSIEQAKPKELTAARLRQFHSRAPEEIARALEPFGYYRPEVRSTLEQDGTEWTARYEIDPGPRMEVSEVSIEVVGPGADDPGFRRAVEGFPLEEGDPLSHSAYEAGKAAFDGYAAAEGYLDAGFDAAELRIDLDRYAAEVALRYDTGPRYFFGPVDFHQRVLEPDLLRGYVTFEPGEPFDLDELVAFQGALSDSPYFQRVEVLPRTEEADELRVPIDVELVPEARQKWDLGVGYGTDTGPRGSVGLELRRINRHGHRGEGELLGSDVERSFAARYLIPGAYPRTDVLTFSLGFAEERPDTSISETALAGVGLTRSRGRWREAFGLTFQRADFEVGLDSGISELLIPEAHWSRVRADDRIYAAHGEKVEFGVRAAEESLVSDSSFAQVTAEAKAVRSLGEWVRAIGRVGVGRTWTSDFRRLPPRIRFFAGGDRSVRGYGYQELGPEDEAGNVIGGEALLTAGVELDSLFLDLGKLGRWGAAVFYDVGGAAGEIGDRLEEGAGAGLRWLSPIGLVRADAAWALTEPGTPVRFHLMIGPDL